MYQRDPPCGGFWMPAGLDSTEPSERTQTARSDARPRHGVVGWTGGASGRVLLLVGYPSACVDAPAKENMRLALHGLRFRRFGLSTLLVTVAATFGTSSILAGELAWRELPDMPVGKWETATALIDSRVYLFGGYTRGVRSSKSSHVFDPEDGNWTRIQDMPSAVSHLNAVVDGLTVWFAGGFKDGYKGHAIAEVWKYDLEKDRFTAAPLLPEPRAAGGLARVGRHLHYLGGLKSDRDTDAGEHWVLDIDSWSAGSARWRNAAPLPVPRNQFSTVAVGTKIYAIGGQHHHDSMQLDQSRVDIYDTATDSWSRGPALPKGHSHAEAGTFVHRGGIYMVGGHTTPAGGRKSVDADILVLRPGGDWELLGKLPMPLSSPAATVVGGKLYVAGGSRNGSSVQAAMWVTDLP